MQTTSMLLVATKAKERSDSELLGLYSRKGDQHAFALLVRRHLDMVIGVCRRSALPTSDMDDVCQAVFILLSRKARVNSWQPSIANWLYTTTRHMVAKTCRANRRFKQLVANHGCHESTVKPDELTVRELFAALDEELERLPAIYREALVLFYFEELSRKEIAIQLGLGIGTIKIRLERARHQLAQRLERRGVMLGLTSIMLGTNAISAQAATSVGTVLNAVNGDGSSTAYQLVKGAAAMQVLARGVVVGMTFFSLIGLGVGWATINKATGQAAGYAINQEQMQSPVKPLIEPPDPVPQEGEWIPCCSYSSDGQWLALSFGRSKKIVQFNTMTWKAELSWKSEYTCYSMCYSADSRLLFTVSVDGAICVWDAHTGKLKGRADTNSGICNKLLLSADSKMLVSAHQDGDVTLLGSDRFTSNPAKNRIHLWDASSLSLTRTFILPEAALLPESVCMSADCKILAAGYHADFHKDGKKLAGFHGVIEWDVQTGRELRRIDTPRITKGATPVSHTLAYTHDGKWLVIGGGEAIPSEDDTGLRLLGRLWLFNRQTGKLDRTLGEDRIDYIRSMTMSPDGSRLFVPVSQPFEPTQDAINNSFPEIQCWDTSTWKLLWTYRGNESEATEHIAVSPNGKRVSLAGAGGHKLLETKEGKLRGGLIKIPRETENKRIKGD